ncbi:MAG TPA: hypothetical protein VGQ37_26135 [Vicinamibacterales bacterium]|jgi:hypothetical protein|nr:hypothetical protein [Vicinamibacterales bacterium]
MLTIKKLASSLGFLLLGAFILAVARPEQAQGAGSAPVTVVNTPLPVALSGSVSGTVQAEQSGQWMVENRDERGRAPYTVHLHCEFADSNGCSVKTPPVPAGTRLVIEHVNVGLQLNAPSQVFSYKLLVGNRFLFFPAHLNVTYGGYNQYAINESVVIYAEAGQEVTAAINATDLGVNQSVTLSGYLVDLM